MSDLTSGYRTGSAQLLFDSNDALAGFVDVRGDDRSLLAFLGPEAEDFMLSTIGDDIMIVTTFALLPSPASVPVGKGAICTDLNNTLFVNSGTAWVCPARSVIARSGVAASKTDADTVEYTAATIALPAGLLKAESQLRLTMLWNVPTGAAAKRLRGRFGGTVLWNLDLTTHESYVQEFRLINRNSVAAQVANPNNSAVVGTYASTDLQTFTVDFAAAQSLTLTVQWPVAGAGSNSITLEGYSVELLP